MFYVYSINYLLFPPPLAGPLLALLGLQNIKFMFMFIQLIIYYFPCLRRAPRRRWLAGLGTFWFPQHKVYVYVIQLIN